MKWHGYSTATLLILAILIWFSPAVLAQNALSLSGNWTAYVPAKNWSHGGYKIIQNEQSLTLFAYTGEIHTGRVLNEDTISYVEAHATGKVSMNGKRIDWSTGGYWLKDSTPGGPAAFGSLSGNWTAYVPAKNWSHGGYKIIQNEQNLTLFVYTGEMHTGRVLNEDTISYVEANATGKVSTDGNRIDWSTGGYWLKDSK